MSLSNLNVLAAYTANGSTSTYSVTASVYDNVADENAQDLEIVTRSTAGVETVLAQSAWTYTSSGGFLDTVTITSVPVVNTIVIVRRKSTLTQAASYTPTGAFPAAQHERVLDKLTRIAQDLNYLIRKSLKFKISSTTMIDVEVDDLVAGSFLKVDSAGTGIEMVADSNYVRAGLYALSSGDTSKAIVFSSTLGTTNYSLMWSITNTVDGSPVQITGWTSVKAATGATISFGAPVDSNNYVLEYLVALHN